MTTPLHEMNCRQARMGDKPLAGNRLDELMEQLDPRWRVVDGHHLAADWQFDDFAAALAWVNEIGGEAEEQDHHPDIRLSYGKVHVDLFTHKIGGLSENDFILAARLDAR